MCCRSTSLRLGNRRQLIRGRLGLAQAELGRRLGLKLERARGWEDRSIMPDATAVTLLRMIWAEPETVRRAVRGRIDVRRERPG